MAGSIFGKKFRVTTFGESHGKALGAVIDGCPAGLELSEEDIQKYLDLRKPGMSEYSTPRREDDKVEILSGVYDGRTTGTPISLVVHNYSQRSSDYADIASYYRPGHADYTFDLKYGFRDPRGGGRSSGRETIGRVAAGAVAIKLLNTFGISISAYTKSIAGIEIDMDRFDHAAIYKDPLRMPDKDASLRASEYLDELRAKGDSAGGVIECRITGVPAGIGEPVFDKLDARLAYAVMSIGAVKAFEIGDGFEAAKATGSSNNDSFTADNEGNISKSSNHSGGTLGGISDGSQIIFRAAVKPTPSVSVEQRTVNRDGKEINISIKGRHDPVIVPRAVVVVEAMAALTLIDLMLENMGSRLS